MFSLNESGQAFSVFRLLISAIMGLMILLIILGVSDYFYKLQLNLGYQRVVDGFSTAANKHDGTVIIIEEAELPAGTQIAGLSIARGSGVEPDCISVTGAQSNSITYNSTNIATIEHNTKISVYIKCEILGACNPECLISLNKKLQ